MQDPKQKAYQDVTLLFPIAYFQQHLSVIAYAGSIWGFLKCPQITVRQTDGFL